MQKQTPHSRMQDASNFIMAAMLILIIVMAFSSCSSEHAGCRMNKGMVGFGNR